MKVMMMLTKNRTGLEQMGLAQAIANSISHLPEELHGMFWGNIGLVGGNTKLPGFVPRLCVISDYYQILRFVLSYLHTRT
jgi:actin-related protein